MENKIVGAEIIKDFCDEYCDEYKYYADYSGRSMYGRCCVGIVCFNPLETLLSLCDYICSNLKSYNIELNDTEPITSVLGYPRTDNMGKDMILYFPKIKTESEENEDE